jgi:hypothetical protein
MYIHAGKRDIVDASVHSHILSELAFVQVSHIVRSELFSNGVCAIKKQNKKLKGQCFYIISATAV